MKKVNIRLARSNAALVPLLSAALAFLPPTRASGSETNAPPPSPPSALSIPSTITNINTANSWGWVTFWSGAKLQNPYTITKSGSSATLTGAPSSTDGYLEINLNSRWVLRSGSFDQLPVAFDNFNTHTPSSSPSLSTPTPPPPTPPAANVIYFVPFWTQMPDIEAQIGYIFRGNSSPTNFSVSTIVGSADIYSDVSLGLPLLRFESAADPARAVKEQVTAEISGGFATDKQFLAVHPNLFLGAGWQGRFPAPNLTGSPLAAIFSGRAGLARIDQPRLLQGATVALDSLGQPAFDPTWAPSLGFEIIYPLDSALNLQAGGNVYFTATPASWNLNLGLTLDLGKFFATLSK